MFIFILHIESRIRVPFQAPNNQVSKEEPSFGPINENNFVVNEPVIYQQLPQRENSVNTFEVLHHRLGVSILLDRLEWKRKSTSQELENEKPLIIF